MDERLAQREITLPLEEVMRPGFDGIQQASDNTEMWNIILKPLLEIAGTPISVGALLSALGMLFVKYERYLTGINLQLLLSFRLFSEILAADILTVLIPDEELRQTIVDEFVSGDLDRTAPDDADHGCDHK